MKKHTRGTGLVRWICVFALLFCPWVATAQLNSQELEALKRSVVKISRGNDGKIGAGIVVGGTDSSVFVLTACHVIAEEEQCARPNPDLRAKEVRVEFLAKPTILFPATLVGHAPKPFDVALVRVDPLSSPPESLPSLKEFPTFLLHDADSMQPITDEVWTIGHAYSISGWQVTKPEPFLNSRSSGEPALFQFGETGIRGGSSGGPVFDMQGRLLGLVLNLLGGGMAEAIKIARAKEYAEGWGDVSLLSKAGETASSSSPPSPPASPSPPSLALLSPPSTPAGMVRVPAGKFFMGCNPEADKECGADEIANKEKKEGKMVEVDAFFIDIHEVTVAEYQVCVGKGECTSTGLTMPYWEGKEQAEWAEFCNWGKTGKEQHPINCLDWKQAETYCERQGKRLPKEAEWEKAARGTEKLKYPWGNTEFRQAGKVANIADETAKKKNPSWTTAEGYTDGYYDTAPVGSFPDGKSPDGALDMIGNVWEWTADRYLDVYYQNSPVKNPEGPDSGTLRSVRGGSWYSLPHFARASYRYRLGPGHRGGDIGARCAQ